VGVRDSGTLYPANLELRLSGTPEAREGDSPVAGNAGNGDSGYQSSRAFGGINPARGILAVGGGIATSNSKHAGETDSA